MATFQDRLIEAMERKNISAAELSRLSGVNEGAISQYKKGAYKAGQRALDKLANALGVSPGWLMGDKDENISPNLTGIRPVIKQKIPLLGKIACGKPIYEHQEFEGYVDFISKVKVDFALLCKGDSMINARINDGDIVFIRKQDTINNGEIAAVSIITNDSCEAEVTLKRVYIHEDSIVLMAENPKYQPMVFTSANTEKIMILGKAIAFQSAIE